MHTIMYMCVAASVEVQYDVDVSNEDLHTGIVLQNNANTPTLDRTLTCTYTQGLAHARCR